MNIIFAGTPDFAVPALKALLNSKHKIVAVYTQPDKPAGRGLKLGGSPIKQLALANQLPVYQPISLKSDEEQQILKSLNADIMVVVAYGMLLPKAVLETPRLGCINIHPSLLPRWRGAAPIQRTLYAGDKSTGVTIMQMDEGLDTGPMLLQKTFPLLLPDDNAKTLHDKLSVAGAEALLETLDLLAENKVTPIPQDNSKATYARKINKEEALIDWHKKASQLENEIKAFNPSPVSYTEWKGQALRVWAAIAVPFQHDVMPGIILYASRTGIDIAAGKDKLRLLTVQFPGGKPIPVRDFYNSKYHELIPGEMFI